MMTAPSSPIFSKVHINSEKMQKSVQFQSVEIIEFAYAVGAHPCVSSGVPITIEREPQMRVTLALDYFEKHRPPKCSRCLRMSSGLRLKILHKSGYSIEEMKSGLDEATIIRKSRSSTLQQLKRNKRQMEPFKLSSNASRPSLASAAPVICTARSA